ncbi:MAG: biotin transporter BioY [Rhodospirillaceae bacterium]|nr:biotin transporter BioY [Rhodospirillaceae bacterium]
MSVKDMVYAALFAALTAALGLLPMIPVLPGVPVTAQSLGVMLSGAILGAKRGLMAQAVFMALVAAGLPLLAGGRGGIGIFLGPTGGFAIGYILGAFVTGWLVERMWYGLNTMKAFSACVVGGIGMVYLLGIPWLGAVSKIGLAKAATSSMIFLPGDLIKAVLAAMLAVAVKKAYPIIKR